MTTRSLSGVLAAAALTLSATGCFRSETPTSPSLPPSSNGVVHLVGQNASTAPLGLASWNENLKVTAVVPGAAVEMMRWNGRTQGFPFLVCETVSGEPFFRPIAQVDYNVLTVPATQAEEVSAVVRISRDASGAVTAVSDRPEVVEIVGVTRM